MFDIPLPIYFFTEEHPLKASNKRTQFLYLLAICFFNLTQDVTIDKLLN